MPTVSALPAFPAASVSASSEIIINTSSTTGKISIEVLLSALPAASIPWAKIKAPTSTVLLTGAPDGNVSFTGYTAGGLALVSLTGAVNTFPYYNGSQTVARTSLTPPARAFLNATLPGSDAVVIFNASASAYNHYTLGANLSVTGSTIAAAGGGGGGGSNDGFDILTYASVSTSHAASNLSGHTVVQMAVVSNIPIGIPISSSFTASTRSFLIYEVSAAGGDRTVSFTTGWTITGITPNQVITSGTNRIFNGWTDGAGAFVMQGDLAFNSYPIKSTVAPTDLVLIANAAASGATYYAPTSALAMVTGIPYNAVMVFDNPTVTTEILLKENQRIGTVVAVIVNTDQNGLTATFDIADKTGASNWTPTNATNITTLVSLSVSASACQFNAGGANTMLKSGTADRILRLIITTVSATVSSFYVELLYNT